LTTGPFLPELTDWRIEVTPRRSGTRPQDFAVSELLEWIDEQELVLPEFQRDYNWTDDRVIALAATIMRGWPAGSLLLQEIGDASFFELRPFTDGPELNEDIASLVVLDGQQRLTALYHALYDVGPSVYAIKASAVKPDTSVDSLEEGMRSFDREVWDRTHRDSPFELDADWIPLYAARSSMEYFAWRDEATKRSSTPEKAALLISDAFRNGLERFQKYRLPAVIVEANLEPAAIARIFERVNRQGLALKTFDLMVARTFIPNWNLRDRWWDACDAHPVLERFFAEDGMPVIQAIALTTLANVREQAVLGLEPSLVRVEWEEAVEAMARAVAFLEEKCGVATPTWIPYGGTIITLAAIEREWRLADHRRDMLRWFLSRSLGLRFETASNTVAVEEYRHLQGSLTTKNKLRKVPISAQVVKEATRKRQGALWRSFMCCLSMAGGVKVGVNGVAEMDAVIPVAIFEKEPSPQGLEPINQLVLNQVLATKSGAREVANIGLKDFYAYLQGLSRTTRERVLKAQLLPADLDPDMSAEEFVEARMGVFDTWLKRHLGYGFSEETESSE
jgi:hypothetical protein